ncbi:MAG: GHMP kinase [Acidobacteria bacterium]|nr:GHMP kinase [Acidobacteriota bacterium]
MRIHSKAPCRVDLAGGTLDIWPLYLFHDYSMTVNVAIDLYATCALQERKDRRIVITSRDQNCVETFASLAELNAAKKYKLALPALLIKFFMPPRGLSMELDCQAPAGAGIAGSSTLNIAICAALDRFTGKDYTLEKLREIAQNVEAQVIRVPTGCQDYYPALYGAVGAVHLTPAGIRREPLDVDLEELERRTSLVYTGAPRNSGINNWQVMKAHIDGERRVFRSFEKIAAIAGAMRRAVEGGHWDEVGRLLAQEWENRRRNAPGISTPFIDRLIQRARRKGALAAKVCGAGGGGCVLLFVEEGAKAAVEQELARLGGRVLPFRVARGGLEITCS